MPAASSAPTTYGVDPLALIPTTASDGPAPIAVTPALLRHGRPRRRPGRARVLVRPPATRATHLTRCGSRTSPRTPRRRARRSVPEDPAPTYTSRPPSRRRPRLRRPRGDRGRCSADRRRDGGVRCIHQLDELERGLVFVARVGVAARLGDQLVLDHRASLRRQHAGGQYQFGRRCGIHTPADGEDRASETSAKVFSGRRRRHRRRLARDRATASSSRSSGRPAAASRRCCARSPGSRRSRAGEISIGGRDVTDLAPRHRDIAMVFQSYALYPHMSVRQNLGTA